jgi:predicted DNA-binding protein
MRQLRQLSFRLAEEDYIQLENLAKLRGATVTEIIRSMIRFYSTNAEIVQDLKTMRDDMDAIASVGLLAEELQNLKADLEKIRETGGGSAGSDDIKHLRALMLYHYSKVLPGGLKRLQKDEPGAFEYLTGEK